MYTIFFKLKITFNVLLHQNTMFCPSLLWQYMYRVYGTSKMGVIRGFQISEEFCFVLLFLLWSACTWSNETSWGWDPILSTKCTYIHTYLTHIAWRYIDTILYFWYSCSLTVTCLMKCKTFHLNAQCVYTICIKITHETNSS